VERAGKLIEWQTLSGEARTVGESIVTPQSQALIVRMPYGGVIWNRPVGILVERDGKVERYPIVDVTRLVLLLLALAGFSMTLMNWLARMSRR
jgi:hypothetical protein